jgi:hypothetical protein
MEVRLGQRFRDTYGDNSPRHGKNLRTIEVVEILPNGVRARTLTDSLGNVPLKVRITTLMFRTLRAGYEQITT